MANPLLGLMFHWLGGLSSASFYVPYKGVWRWSWEIFWLTGGIVSWLVAPWFFAAPDPLPLQESPIPLEPLRARDQVGFLRLPGGGLELDDPALTVGILVEEPRVPLARTR